tara:strand:- start:1156 stop:1386 length:231 start_codon:yes stop_codon:yes gene_type:complete
MTSNNLIKDTDNIKISNDVNGSEKPLNPDKISSGRVDINILKSKLDAEQSKEFRKNIFIFLFCVFLLGIIGVYLSL